MAAPAPPVRPHGIALNNPCNVRAYAGVSWHGVVPEGPPMPELLRFEGMQWGVRAATRILRSYGWMGIATAAGVLHRWTQFHGRLRGRPGDDLVLCRLAEFAPGGVVSLDSPAHMLRLLLAIARHENPDAPLGPGPFEDGMGIAGLDVPSLSDLGRFDATGRAATQGAAA
jgi:hypothetical protein